MFKIVIYCLISLFILPLAAEQLSFNKSEQENSYTFNYQWLDAQQKTQQLSIALSKNALFNRFRQFRTFQPKIAALYINKATLNAWQADPMENVQLKLAKKDAQYQLLLSTNNKQLLPPAKQKLAQLKQQATTTYLSDNFYHQFTNYLGQQAIKPDHNKMASMFVDDFKAIKDSVLEAVDVQNIRHASNYILGFVQAIPYAKLQSRVTSLGAGFNPPGRLLWENQGDCDSKTTLTVAMLRALMPRIKIVFVYINNHALIGINAPPQPNDFTLKFNNQTFILAEPTGPASLALGKVAQSSKLAINNGLYSIESFTDEK